jgi:hypothetical protein
MRKMLISGAVALLCAAAVPAVAAPAARNAVQNDQATATTEAQQPTQSARSRDRSRVTCVMARVSETRIPQRICRTQAEWELERAGE